MSDKLEERKRKLDEQLEKTQLRKKLLLIQERKKRALKFKDIGKLAYQANIDHLDDTVLLGAFLEISSNISDEKINKWMEAAQNLKNNKPLDQDQIICISFLEEPNKEIKNRLKENKFTWNRFRKEFCGKGKKDEIEIVLKDCKFKIEVVNT